MSNLRTEDMMMGRDNEADGRAMPPSLIGWSGIEDHLLKHDMATVKDYADDINSLLVFAGLFSAVLTAFVVQTYSLLQPDTMSTTNRLLAASLSSRGFHTTFSEEEVNKLITRQDFSPFFVARWINGLLFVSLVLSLAAAFFGIIAKQWLREYMKWNSALASPRENVLVRQGRFEAWETWHVATIMSSIPVLLELAMVLFLGGITVLLWTLDNVVAAVVTAVVVFFLGAAGAFTVLPVLSKRCPYRSRTAWAGAVALEAIRSSLQLLHDFSSAMRSEWDVFPGSPSRAIPLAWHAARRSSVTRNSWRDWDIFSIRIAAVQHGDWFSGSSDLREIARTELHNERSHIGPDGHVWSNLLPVQVDDTKYEAADALLKDLGETIVLLRALAWVQRASCDGRVHHYVDECLRTVHSDASFCVDSSQVAILTNWLLILSTRQSPLAPHHLQSFSSMPHSLRLDGTRAVLSVVGLRQMLGVRAYYPESPDQDDYTFSQVNTIQRLSLADYMDSNCHLNPLLFRMITLSLDDSVSQLKLVMKTQNSGDNWLSLQVRRVVEMFAAIQDISRLMSWWGTGCYIDSLRSILQCNSVEGAELDSRAPGLRFTAFRQARLHARVVVSSRHASQIDVVPGDMKRSDYEDLLANGSNIDFRHCSDDEFKIFVELISGWLYYSPTVSPTNFRSILTNIADAVWAVPYRNRSRGKCVTFDTDWIQELLLWLENETRPLECFGLEVRRLLHALEKMYLVEASSLPSAPELPLSLEDNSDTLRSSLSEPLHFESLHYNLERAHKDLGSCERSHCHWLSHTCESPTSCAVLHPHTP